jgi:PhoH-like ATPase
VFVAKETAAKATSTKAAGSKPAQAKTATKTYVLDTSVLLSDPKALFKFKEQEVVIPIVVINELGKKRHDPEIGYYARQALRHLDDLRIQHERLDFPMEVGEGGLLRVN